MQPHMICRTVQLTGYAGVRAVFVSVPLVPCLLDGVKFMLPGDVPRLEGTEAYRARAPRGPSMRTLVKMSLKSDATENSPVGWQNAFHDTGKASDVHGRQRQRRVRHRPGIIAPGSLWKIADGNGPVKLMPRSPAMATDAGCAPSR